MEARERQIEIFSQQETLNYKYLITNRKLILFVDLDSTIIVSYKREVCQLPLKPDFSSRGKDFFKRPRLKEFLEYLSPYYEFVVATDESYEYAEAVLNDVDKDGELFKKRILAQCMIQVNKMSFMDYLVTSVCSMIVAIDDLPVFWHDRSFVVEVLELEGRVTNDDFYFRENQTRRFAPYLDVLAKSLKQIHEDYYTDYDKLNRLNVNTCNIVSILRTKILKNCTICLKYFSQPKILERYIEVLKPFIHKEVIHSTTHVVVSKLIDVPKRILKFPHVKFVTKEWLFHSLKGLVQCDEHHYKPN